MSSESGLTEIEQEFHELAPELIDEIHSAFKENRKVSDTCRVAMCKSGYCLIGESRRNLELPVDYYAPPPVDQADLLVLSKNLHRCVICSRLANSMMSDIGVASKVPFLHNKEEYLTHLKEFKEHLEKDHGIKELKKKNQEV